MLSYGFFMATLRPSNGGLSCCWIHREGKDEDGVMLGFGAVLIDEADDMRREFETKFKGDEARFFEYSK